MFISTVRIMYCRTYTTPAFYYASKSIVGGRYIFTFTAPVMVYVEYQCTGIDEFQTSVESPFVFIVLDRDCVSRLRRKSCVDCVFDTGWTLPTGYMDVAFKVLEGTPVSHPPDDIGVIFKFFYAPLNYFRVVARKYSKLAWVHR